MDMILRTHSRFITVPYQYAHGVAQLKQIDGIFI
jgi:hypothetical protein